MPIQNNDIDVVLGQEQSRYDVAYHRLVFQSILSTLTTRMKHTHLNFIVPESRLIDLLIISTAASDTHL